MAKERRIIMLVDDNTTNLAMGKNILSSYYNVFPIPSGAQLFEILARVRPDLILLDIIMPEMDGYEVIKRLKADPKTSGIPVIFVTTRSDTGSELDGFSLGAIDYISKPFSPPLLLKRIENHLLLSSRRAELSASSGQILELQCAVINALAAMAESRDDVTGRRISRAREYLDLLVSKLIESGLYKEETEKWDLNFLIPASQLYDVGKIGIRAIEEAAKATGDHKFLTYAKIFAGAHHEKWDGTGRPGGLKGLEIPLEGRLMAIADAYDTLISERPCKDPLTFKEAERIIIEGKGVQFDPALIGIFKTLADSFAAIARE